jgi:hypothetical protein
MPVAKWFPNRLARAIKRLRAVRPAGNELVA